MSPKVISGFSCSESDKKTEKMGFLRGFSAAIWSNANTCSLNMMIHSLLYGPHGCYRKTQISGSFWFCISTMSAHMVCLPLLQQWSLWPKLIVNGWCWPLACWTLKTLLWAHWPQNARLLQQIHDRKFVGLRHRGAVRRRTCLAGESWKKEGMDKVTLYAIVRFQRFWYDRDEMQWTKAAK